MAIIAVKLSLDSIFLVMSNSHNSNLDYLLKQSEMLQGAIARMASNSLEIKKVGLTVWAALVGFGFTEKSIVLFILALVAFALFGLLDIYYLHEERNFRDNFNRLSRIINGYATHDDETWSERARGNFLKPDSSRTFFGQLPSTLKSWANLPYLITLFITIALIFLPLPSK